jgi:hypothetical protein
LGDPPRISRRRTSERYVRERQETYRKDGQQHHHQQGDDECETVAVQGREPLRWQDVMKSG